MINTQKIKQVALPNLPYVFIWWLFTKIGEAYRLSQAQDSLQKIIDTINSLGTILANPIPAFNLFDIAVGLAGAAGICLIVYIKKKNAKKWRKEDNPGLHFAVLMNQGEVIGRVISSMLNNLLWGCLLAVVILLLFLRDIRPTLIIAVSIPVSIPFCVLYSKFVL